MDITLDNIRKIIQLSRKDKGELKKLNAKNERAYQGKLNRHELIYQIVCLEDAPYELASGKYLNANLKIIGKG